MLTEQSSVNSVGCMLCEGTVKCYVLSDVLHVPKLVNNFFSVTAATQKGHQITFKDKRCTIRYDMRCYFNVRSKADISQLNLPHGTDN